MLMAASRGAVTASMLATFVDVITGVSGLAVVDDMLTDEGYLVPWRCGLRMNRCLFLLSGGLRKLLRGKPAASQGETLGLLHGRSLEETSNLIAGPVGLGYKWLRHIAEKHGGGNNVLAGSVEDWGFTRPVLDDVTIDVTSSLSSSSATCARRVLPPEGLLKQAQALSFLIELGLRFLNLLELRSLVCFKKLGFVSRTRERGVRWCGIPPSSSCLCF
jgi:hypothetical protein